MLRSIRPRSVFSRLFQLSSPPPCHHAAASQRRLVRRLFPFFSESGHATTKRSPPLILPHGPEKRQPLAPSWHHNPRKVAAATALVTSAAWLAVHLRYGETVPFTGRTHLVVLSNREAREIDEAEFERLKKVHASESEVLGPSHPHTIRVRHIAREIITAAHAGLIIKQKQMGGRSLNLDWADSLDWEVIVVRDRAIWMGTLAGAGKIIVFSGVLDYFKSDAEIAALLAHEVAHVVAGHASDMISNWFPFKFLLRRQEIEADRIGIILFAAAGFDPRICPLVWDKFPERRRDSALARWVDYFTKEHPSKKTRSQLLSQPKVMEEALEFYSQVRPRVQPQYPKVNTSTRACRGLCTPTGVKIKGIIESNFDTCQEL